MRLFVTQEMLVDVQSLRVPRALVSGQLEVLPDWTGVELLRCGDKTSGECHGINSEDELSSNLKVDLTSNKYAEGSIAKHERVVSI